MHLHHRCALAVVLFLGSMLSAAQQTYYLPLNGHLHFNVPDGWTAGYTPSKGSWDQPTITVQRGDLVLTFVPLKEDGSAIPGDEEVRLITNSSVVTPYWKRSTDKNLKLDEIRNGEVFGLLGTYTIAKPAEGEKPNVTVGLIRLNRVLIKTMIQHTEKDNADKAAAMEIIKGATLDVATPARLRLADRVYTITVDGRWKVTAKEEGFWPNKPHLLDAVDESRGWTLAVRTDAAQPKLPEAIAAAEHDRARAHFLAKLKADGAKIENVKESTVAYWSVGEWDNGGEKHALSCYATESTWISVHLAKAKYDEKADRATLDELLNSVLATREAPLPGKKKLPASGGGKKKPSSPQPKPKPDDDFDF